MAKPPAGSSLFNRGPLFQEPPSPPRDEGSTPPPGDGGSTSPSTTKPPAGSSLLFGALADSGRIKECKNGTYRMLLKKVDEIDWFTDRPTRFAGEWSPKKLVKKWDGLFGDGAGAPNAQATFEVGSKRELVTFEMFKPKLADSNQTLSFKVRRIGKKNKDLLTGLRNKQLSDASLFIDGSLPSCLPNCKGANLIGADLNNAKLAGTNLNNANLTRANLTKANLTKANLTRADLNGATLTGTNLKDANLFGVTLNSADMTGANLGYANLTGAKLNSADLTDAVLNGANLTGADLYRADLTGASYDLKTIWPTTGFWDYTTCPNGSTNSNRYTQCGFESLR